MDAKVSFRYLCNGYKLDEDALFALANQSGVPKSVIDVMILGSPVERADAEKVLAAFSQQTNYTWNFENVDVKLIEEV